MPELPAAMRARFVSEYALPEYDALVLTHPKPWPPTSWPWWKAGKDNAKAAANWLMGDVSSTLNREGVDIADAPVSPRNWPPC
jgi:aspartyl-tRNA(Asn)/glutamyl-tRNA(Gln) amidotransferase subunit B